MIPRSYPVAPDYGYAIGVGIALFLIGATCAVPILFWLRLCWEAAHWALGI